MIDQNWEEGKSQVGPDIPICQKWGIRAPQVHGASSHLALLPSAPYLNGTGLLAGHLPLVGSRTLTSDPLIHLTAVESSGCRKHRWVGLRMTGVK